ncbi:MAG: ABC transporter ATP-binding protein [Actinomycetales bacterium]|nr:ABC transporter ATP-binding protein [Actinomycetales bacterium]
MTTQNLRGPAVRIENLTKRYRDVLAVDGVSLSAAPGETLGILGANGAGKTTTVEMIAGLRRPDGGSVSVRGLDPFQDRARVRQILGVQLQEGYLHGALTVDELLTLYRSFYPDPRPHAELLELVELRDKAGERFEKLSGGQRQRVSVALALAGRPRVLILDELTTGLDPGARRRMWRTIEQLRAEGVTVLLVSHAMDEVARLCDRIVLLEGGRVLSTGTPAEVTAEAGAATLEDAFVTLTGQELHEREVSE